MHADADFEMAVRLRQGGVPLGDLFTFISGLYFRGKLAYARTFCDVPPGTHGVLVITSSGGLVSPEAVITLKRLQEIASGSVDPLDRRYTTLLERGPQIISREPPARPIRSSFWEVLQRRNMLSPCSASSAND